MSNSSKSMSDLNNRFVNFLNLVKSETQKNEHLHKSLQEEKDKYIKHFLETNAGYNRNLLNVKKDLNQVCLDVCGHLVREKHYRIVGDWFARLANFELNNLQHRPKYLLLNYDAAPTSMLLNDYLSDVNSLNFYMVKSSSSEPPPFDTSTVIHSYAKTTDYASSEPNANNLLNLSAISTSQSSINSCSSCTLSISPSSSSSSNSNSTSSPSCGSYFGAEGSSSSCMDTNENVTIKTASSPLLTTTTSAHFSLEQYLSTLSRTRTQLRDDFDKKQAECEQLKEKITSLNTNINHLNDNLDEVKLENVSLEKEIEQMRKEIDFYRKLNRAKGKDNAMVNGKQWYKGELDEIKADLVAEFDEFNSHQLKSYETALQDELMSLLEKLDEDYVLESAKLEDESNEILDELIDLNGQLIEDFKEYETLTKINSDLNDRLLSLSSYLIEFNSLEKESQERRILAYSVNSLRAQNKQLKLDIANLQREYGSIKSKLTHSDAYDLLFFKQANIQSLNLKFSQLKSVISELNLLTPPNEQRAVVLDENNDQSDDHKKSTYQIRPYYAQIEYTKSNLFAYFIIKFDIIYHNYAKITNNLSVPKLQTKKNLNTMLSCIKIVNDSIDGHSILLENTHKILDIDLSEWTLRREVYNDFRLNCSNDFNKLVLNEANLVSDFVVEYKFPKAFKLKRRKKVNLIAAGSNFGSNVKIATTSTIQTHSEVAKVYDGKKLIVDLNSSTIKSHISYSCYSLNSETDYIKKFNQFSISSNSLKTTSNIQQSESSLQVQQAAKNQPANVKNVAKETMKLTKCGCCACKTMVTRIGDVEFFEVKEISNWGSGILVITKLINNKNVKKLVNYKYLKHIWINNQ